jgi:hypothetical protein
MGSDDETVGGFIQGVRGGDHALRFPDALRGEFGGLVRAVLVLTDAPEHESDQHLLVIGRLAHCRDRCIHGGRGLFDLHEGFGGELRCAQAVGDCIGVLFGDADGGGDILGALTGTSGIAGSSVGKIFIFDFVSYVAVERAVASKALGQLQNGTIKGRKYRIRKL